MSDLHRLEFQIMFNGKPTKFVMQEMLGEEDEQYIVKYTSVEGKTDMAALWVERLARSVVEPSMNKTTIKQLTRKQLSLLKAKWLELNEATKEDFLANSGAGPAEPTISP